MRKCCDTVLHTHLRRPQVLFVFKISSKNITLFGSYSNLLKTSTLSDGPPLRLKTINLVKITKINLKTSTVWKKMSKNSQKPYKVTTCNVFLTKKGPKRPKPDFSRNFHLFFSKVNPKCSLNIQN